jgi:hypothetical protein
LVLELANHQSLKRGANRRQLKSGAARSQRAGRKDVWAGTKRVWQVGEETSKAIQMSQASGKHWAFLTGTG